MIKDNIAALEGVAVYVKEIDGKYGAAILENE